MKHAGARRWCVLVSMIAHAAGASGRVLLTDASNALQRELTTAVGLERRSLQRWEESAFTEVAWWQEWFATKGLQWREDYAQRMDPASELEEGLKALVVRDASTTVRLLDVGSGPVTSVGKVWTGYDLQITAIDPLADAYADLYRDAGVSPPIVPLKLDGEKLSSRLPMNHFDIVHAKNAIDHSYNAPQVLREMVAVAKPGGVVVVLVNENVAEHEQQWGLHQWNFEAVPRIGDGQNGGARDVFVHNHGEVVECAAVERIRVLEGYKEYAARYLELHIRKSPAPCSA